jgi:hypothetical protein
VSGPRPGETGLGRDWNAVAGRQLVDVIDDLLSRRGTVGDWQSLHPRRRYGEPQIENLGPPIDGLHEALAPLLDGLGRGEVTVAGVSNEGFQPMSVPASFWRLVQWEIRRTPPAISSRKFWCGEPCLSLAQTVSCVPGIAPPKHRGGRPRIYGWDDFFIEVIRLANTPDGLPPRQELHQHMLNWALATWESRPADSTIREKIERICSALDIGN